MSKVILKAIIGALVVLVLIDLTPLGGNIYVYVKLIECGGNMPVQSGYRVFDDKPYYTSTPAFTIIRGVRQYFCTPTQAEQAGYSADRNSYSYPHLSQGEQKGAFERSKDI